MQSIGGYFELECGHNPLYHADGVYLNICRSAIRYLIRALGIRRIFVPYYTCHVVADAIRQEGCALEFYHIDSQFLPTREFGTTDFVIYNNYFGVLGTQVEQMADAIPNLIVDNAQAFYSRPRCRASVYSPRKFFGLPDGGILRGSDIPLMELEKSHSAELSSHLLKRKEYGANAGYADFSANEEELDRQEVMGISNLTLGLMGNIDYEYVRQRRLANFAYLQKHIPTDFPLALAEDDVPQVYPLIVKDGKRLREMLHANDIFVARYWPNVTEWCTPDDFEYQMADDIIPLPIDQRYGEREMQKIVEVFSKGEFNGLTV